MDSNRRHELLSDYIENTLSPGDRAAMEAELRANPEARAELASLRGIWRGLDTLASAPEKEPPMFFRDNVMSAIERTATRKGYWPGEKAVTARLPLWQRLFPNAGRLAVGAAFGAALAAVGFITFSGNGINTLGGTQFAKTGVPLSRVANGLVLPYQGQVTDDDIVEATPRLVISTGNTLTPDAMRACDFTFWLENAPQGSARFTLLNSGTEVGTTDPAIQRFQGLSDQKAQTLRIPFDSTKTSVLALQVHWTAVGAAHDRYLFVPTNATPTETANETALVNTPPVAFTLAEMPLIDALKETTSRTGIPITVEDVSSIDGLRVALATSGKERISTTLRRSVAPLGLHVFSSASGILITSGQR